MNSNGFTGRFVIDPCPPAGQVSASRARLAVALILSLGLIVSACGDGDGGGDMNGLEQLTGPRTVTELSRGPFTQTELAEIGEAETVLALPWGTGTLNRPASVRARAEVSTVEAHEDGELRRLVFWFGADAANMPGYRLERVPHGTDPVCEGASEMIRVFLVTPMDPAVGSDVAEAGEGDGEAGAAVDADAEVAQSAWREPSGEVVRGTCEPGGDRVTVVAMDAGNEHRAVELRDPFRLVVEAR